MATFVSKRQDNINVYNNSTRCGCSLSACRTRANDDALTGVTWLPNRCLYIDHCRPALVDHRIICIFTIYVWFRLIDTSNTLQCTLSILTFQTAPRRMKLRHHALTMSSMDSISPLMTFLTRTSSVFWSTTFQTDHAQTTSSIGSVNRCLATSYWKLHP